jgi:hypothetical protein
VLNQNLNLIKEATMKIKYFIGLVLSLAVLQLSGCGKKSNSTPPPVVTQPTSTTAITGIATKGPIIGATVQAFAIRSNVTDTVPLGQAKTDNKGNYTIGTFGYKGPVVVQVTGGSYTDEITQQPVILKTPLRAMFSSVQTTTTTIVVSPLTELAAKNAEGYPVLTGDVIDGANRFVGLNFGGLTNIVGTVPNAASTDLNQTGYAAALKIFSQMVIDSMEPGELAAGQTMDDALATVMTSLGNEMLQNPLVISSTTASAWAFATNLCGTDLTGCTGTPPSTTPIPPNPVGGVLKLATTGPAASAPNGIFQITMTLTLASGVTVSTSPGSNEAGGVSAHLSTLLDPKTTTLTALVTNATATLPGKIDIVVGATKGFPIGQFLTINFNLAPQPNPVPAIADFPMTGVLIQGLKLATLNGITISPALTFF